MKEYIEKLQEAARQLNTAIDNMWNHNEGISSMIPDRYIKAINVAQQNLYAALNAPSPVIDVDGWISVNELLPNRNLTIDVVIKNEYGQYRIPNAEYRLKDMWSKSERFEIYQHTDNGMQWVDITGQVTHWMLPPVLPGGHNKEYLAARQVPVESEESVQANCRDCNLPYSEFGVDVVLPNTQWEDIFPEKDGLLCGTCIAKRADKLKGILYISAVLVNNTKSS